MRPLRTWGLPHGKRATCSAVRWPIPRAAASHAATAATMPSIEGRSNDVFGLAFAHARTSNALRRLGTETAAITDTPNNIRRHETVIETTYLYRVAPWWSLQPTLQFVFNPGAALPSSLNSPPQKNSLTGGVRTKIDF